MMIKMDQILIAGAVALAVGSVTFLEVLSINKDDSTWQRNGYCATYIHHDRSLFHADRTTTQKYVAVKDGNALGNTTITRQPNGNYAVTFSCHDQTEGKNT